MTAGKRERRGFLRQKMVWRQCMGGCESNPQTQNNENENSLEKEEDSHKVKLRFQLFFELYKTVNMLFYNKGKFQ